MDSDGVSNISAWQDLSELPVPFDEALDAWAGAARSILIETAQAYGAFLTQAELASKVQTDTGIRAGGPVRLWIDDLLAAVTRTRGADEPLLAALCVRLDQSVGESYRKVLDLAGQPSTGDLDADAAHMRFRCYQHFGAVVPAGAKATLTPRVAEKRAARKPAAKPRAAKSPAAGATAARSTRAKSAAATSSTAKADKPKAAPKPKAEPTPEPKPKLCPTCFTVLSTSGVCGYCS